MPTDNRWVLRHQHHHHLLQEVIQQHQQQITIQMKIVQSNTFTLITVDLISHWFLFILITFDLGHTNYKLLCSNWSQLTYFCTHHRQFFYTDYNSFLHSSLLILGHALIRIDLKINFFSHWSQLFFFTLIAIKFDKCTYHNWSVFTLITADPFS